MRADILAMLANLFVVVAWAVFALGVAYFVIKYMPLGWWIE